MYWVWLVVGLWMGMVSVQMFARHLPPSYGFVAAVLFMVCMLAALDEGNNFRH